MNAGLALDRLAAEGYAVTIDRNPDDETWWPGRWEVFVHDGSWQQRPFWLGTGDTLEDAVIAAEIQRRVGVGLAV